MSPSRKYQPGKEPYTTCSLPSKHFVQWLWQQLNAHGHPIIKSKLIYRLSFKLNKKFCWYTNCIWYTTSSRLNEKWTGRKLVAKQMHHPMYISPSKWLFQNRGGGEEHYFVSSYCFFCNWHPAFSSVGINTDPVEQFKENFKKARCDQRLSAGY